MMKLTYSEQLCSVLAHALAERLNLALYANGIDMSEMTATYYMPVNPDDNGYAICATDENCDAQNFLQNLDGTIKQGNINVGRTEDDSWAFIWEKADDILNFMEVLEAIAAAPHEKKKSTQSPYPGDESFRKTIRENPVLLYFASSPDGYASLNALFKAVQKESHKYDGGYFTFSLERLRTLAAREEYVSLPSERLNSFNPKKA